MRTIEPLDHRGSGRLLVSFGDIYKAKAGIGEGSLPSHARFHLAGLRAVTRTAFQLVDKAGNVRQPRHDVQ